MCLSPSPPTTAAASREEFFAPRQRLLVFFAPDTIAPQYAQAGSAARLSRMSDARPEEAGEAGKAPSPSIHDDNAGPPGMDLIVDDDANGCC